mmetsp:Transcript_16678/g.24512  ORF Transcript_16678/g.24512 Transcript_16678/m.24512 type:complete len:126 (-) Transcript_16678:1632-2009(-)
MICPCVCVCVRARVCMHAEPIDQALEEMEARQGSLSPGLDCPCVCFYVYLSAECDLHYSWYVKLVMGSWYRVACLCVCLCLLLVLAGAEEAIDRVEKRCGPAGWVTARSSCRPNPAAFWEKGKEE